MAAFAAATVIMIAMAVVVMAAVAVVMVPDRRHAVVCPVMMVMVAVPVTPRGGMAVMVTVVVRD